MNQETEASIKLIEQHGNASSLLKKNIDIHNKEAQDSSIDLWQFTVHKIRHPKQTMGK